MNNTLLTGGLSDPVFGSQTHFRDLLDAMAQPGIIKRIDEHLCGVPHNLPLAAAACLLTLVDYETPVWLGREFTDIRSWLAFHTGAPIATDYRDARFAVMSGQSSSPKFTDFPLGEDRYPDLSATLIVICSSLEGGATIRLTGPGVETEKVIAPQGLHDQFWAHHRDNHALYPLGCDVILVAGSQLLALPRSVKSVESS